MSPALAAAAAGAAVLVLVGSRPAPSRVAALRRVLAVPAHGSAPRAAAAAGWRVARVLRRWHRQHPATRDRDVARELPDVVDLLALAVGAGLSVPAAVPAIAPLAATALRADLLAAADALAAGQASDVAIVELGRRWGPPARPLVHALTDHLRYGTAVLPALQRVATEARAARRRGAEIRARRLPVLLLFPLVLCTLPAFGLLTVAPLVAGTFDSLRGGHLEAPASVAP